MFKSFQNSNGLLPLILGVTGHRDPRPEDLPELRKQLKRVLGEIRGRWTALQGEKAGALYLLSGMAAGADQLAAECAWEEGIKVIAVLTTAPEKFEEDFHTEPERVQLRSYLGRCVERVVMPDDGSGRTAKFKAVGIYISRKSSILLALWNGVYTNKLGGTSDVVKMKLRGTDSDLASPFPALEISSPGPVCQVVTPRMSDELHPTIEVLVHEWDQEKDKTSKTPFDDPHSLFETFQRPAEYNADWMKMPPEEVQRAAKSTKNFVPVPPGSEDDAFLREHYGVASTLAKYYQKKSERLVKWYFVLLGIASFFLEGGYYFYPLEEKKGLLLDPCEAVYAGLMIFLIGMYLFSNRKNYHDRYHEYRSLAEALRVQLFWRMGGLNDSVANHYPAHQVTDLGWISKALSALHLPLSPPARSDWPALQTYWVEGQLKYFRGYIDDNGKKVMGAIERNYRDANRWIKLGNGFFAFTLVWMFIRAFAPWVYERVTTFDQAHQTFWTGPLEGSFMLMAGTSVIAVVFYGYEHFRSYSENAKRYQAMIPLYEIAKRALTAEPFDLPVAQKVTRQLGREAVAENGYWLAMHHQQELDLD